MLFSYFLCGSFVLEIRQKNFEASLKMTDDLISLKIQN